MHKILTIIGTRPEAIKMAPVAFALNKCQEVEHHLGLTGQHHRDMLDSVLNLFQVPISFELKLDRTDPSLASLTSELVDKLYKEIVRIKPNFVLVHGDTTTAFCGALAAFYAGVAVGHVEAGLRTARFESPFPEEMNRRLIARLASLHFAPTFKAARNLYAEGIKSSQVYVTGNTVVDALNHVLKNTYPTDLNQFPMIPTREVILVTCHRRESWGKPMEDLCDTIEHLTSTHSNYIFVWPVHPNPAIVELVRSKLGHNRQVRLPGPLDYKDFVWLLNVCQLVITDSGGVLEEAAVLGVPTLVLRQETERPEALELRGVELVGYDFDLLREKIISFILKPPHTERSDSFGSGDAGELIVDILLKYLGDKNATTRS